MSNKKTPRPIALRVVGYVINKIWLLLATLIISLAMFFLILELLLPEVNRYKTEIETWIENQYQVDVEVDTISAKWSSHGPSISLINFAVFSSDKKFNLFKAGSLSIEFDLLASLLNKEYSTHSVQLQNANMRFYIDKKLGVKLNTFSVLQDEIDSNLTGTGQIEDTSKRFFELLVAQKKIEIHNSKLELMTLGGSSFNYDVEDLTVKKYPSNHQLVGHLKHIEDSVTHSNSIKIIAEVHKGIEENENYTNLYLGIDKIELASLPKVGHLFDLKGNDENKNISDSKELDAESNEGAAKTNASLNMWARWQNRHWQKMDTQISLNGDKSLSTILSWRNEDYHHGYAELHDFSISNPQSIESTNDLTISKGLQVVSSSEIENNVIDLFDGVVLKYVHEEKENISWNIAVSNFNLSPILNYLPSVISKDVDGLALLNESDLKLQLGHLKMSFTKSKRKWYSSDLTLDFSNLKVKSQKNIPTFSDLHGWLFYDTENSLFQSALHSQSSDILIDELFREKIPVDTFSVNISSDLRHGFNALNISNLNLENKDLKLNADAKFYFDDDEPNLSLKAKIQRGNVSQTFRYLPTGIMSESLVNYLDSSIRSGDLFATNAILRGPIKQFPYPDDIGIFAVLAKVKDVNYRYLPEWPLVTDVSANLLFEGTGMFIDVHTAQSLNNRVTSAEVNIIDMKSDNSNLDLVLNIDSSNNQGRSFLKETPLDFISDGLDSLDLIGQIRTEIDLTVPLSSDDETASSAKDSDLAIKLLGSVQPLENGLTLKLPFVEAKRVKGKLSFNEKGIIKSEMIGYVDKQKIHANIQSIDEHDPVNNEHRFMKIDLAGQFSSESIDQFIDGNWSDFLSGNTDFNGEILFSNLELKDNSEKQLEKVSKIALTFNSALIGVAFEMPDFLNKEKSSSDLFQLDMTVINSRSESTQQGKVIWKELDAEWRLKTYDKETLGKTLDSEYSVFVDLLANQQTEGVKGKKELLISGASNIKWEHPNGVTVSGQIDELNVIDWNDFIEKISDNYSPTLKEGDNPVASNPVDDNVKLLVNKVVLSISEIFLPDVEVVSAVKLTADKYIDLPWRLSLESNQGSMDVIFDESSPWLVNAKNIDLNFIEQPSDNKELNAKKSDTAQAEQLIRHAKIHSSLSEMDIGCDFCQFNKKNLGNIKASLRRDPKDDSLSLKAKVEKGAEHQISLSGIWSIDSLKSTGEGVEKTDINFSLSTNNVGKLLKHWGFQPSIEDSKGKVMANLNWNNSPWRMDYKKINGAGRLDFGKGYLSQISDEEGRIIALFNLKSILRKLTFDFKDVYKKGFFYDSMGGTVNIDNGVITTFDTNIKGNVADVQLFGTTDLKNEIVEQHAIVSPHITSSFPVLAAWALEPTTGVIVYLLSKIMEPAIDVATQIDYRVHGSFDKPIVDEIKKSKQRVKIDLTEERLKREQNIKNANPPNEKLLNDLDKTKIEKDNSIKKLVIEKDIERSGDDND